MKTERDRIVQTRILPLFCAQSLAHPGAVWVEVPWAKVTLWVVPGAIFSLQGWHHALAAFNVCLASFSDNADFSKEGLVEVTSWLGPVGF